ncbi:MAG TPA: Rieske (2Fe-2S) protein, partial [Gammaproteobacteria bacterium]|nr:Rieske (2Fe-2S) protein [Gammaproteobacteria bacterium]
MNAPQQLNLDNFSWPDEGLTRVPYRIFTDPAVHDLEQQRIFRGPTWSYAGIEAELPNPGDYITTFIGDTPVVVSRDQQGGIHAFVNRCAHRGALVCRQLRGNTDVHTCVYHQWAFDHKGDLVGVPFRRGLAGKGGYPKDFDMAQHGLQKLRVSTLHGLIYVTFDQDLEPLES